jgi:DNA-binding CsgD family transcriptional regulator
MNKIWFIFSCLFFWANALFAEDLEIKSFGDLFVTNYSPTEYKGEKQNWDICIGSNGLIYFANGSLLEAGTKSWKRYYLPSYRYVRSVYALADNSIFVGGNFELGIYKPGALPGQHIYKSLMNRLDPRFYSFSTVWQILPFHQSYIIRAGKALLKYENDTIIPLIYGRIVDYTKIINETIFVRILNEGFGFINKDKFQLFPFGQDFSNVKIVGIEALNEKEYLIFTDDNGVFITDKNTIRPYNILNHNELIKSQISKVCFLCGKYFAIGTVKNGLFIYDLAGKLIQHLNKKNGLQNNTIMSMQADSINNLWLGLDYGISYVELNSCVSRFYPETDIGSGYVSKYYKGNLYLGTNQGLFYMKWDTLNSDNNAKPEIREVKNTTGQVYDIYSDGNVLYCGHHKGLLRVDVDKAVLLNPVEGCWQISSLIGAPGYFLESTYRGYYLLMLNQKGELLMKKKLDAIPDNSRTFKEDKNGFLWLSTYDNRIFRFTIDKVKLDVSGMTDMTKFKGLPNFNTVTIVGNKGQIFISTNQGLFSYNYSEDQFENNEMYNQVIGKDEKSFEFYEDNYNRIWYIKNHAIGYFSLHFGNPEKVFLPFNKILNVYSKLYGRIGVIDKDNVFFGVDDGFYHFKCNSTETIKKNYHVFISNLTTSSSPKDWNRSDPEKDTIPIYRYKKNAFEFFFTSDFFQNPDNVHYQFKLDGFDDVWSEWSLKSSKEYNNLHEGTYSLKVRARDENGNESNEDSFTFEITPPYYRSTLAYIVYLVLLSILIIILRKLRIRQIEMEKKKVEEKKQLEIEQKKKQYEEEQLKAQQKIMELEYEKIQQDLLYKTKELSNSTLNILHKNEILLEFKEEMQKLYMEKNISKRDRIIHILMRTIDSEMSSKRDLEIFDLNFSAVHEDFIKILKERFPSLNQNDLRLCTFLKMNKTTKEIASLMNMSIRGVETSRYRLRKKMGLDRDGNLYDIITEI